MNYALREPELAVRDVRDGKIPVGRAQDVYRVAVSADGVMTNRPQHLCAPTHRRRAE